MIRHARGFTLLELLTAAVIAAVLAVLAVPSYRTALLRARRFLKQKYGTVYVSFADPISLDGALGELKERFSQETGSPQIAEERRRFVQQLGFRILREVNGCAVAGATSISATVMLAASHRGKLYEEYAAQANALAGLIKYQGITPTASPVSVIEARPA